MSDEKKQIVQEDSYIGNSLANTSKFMDQKGFRFADTKVESLQVSHHTDYLRLNNLTVPCL